MIEGNHEKLDSGNEKFQSEGTFQQFERKSIPALNLQPISFLGPAGTDDAYIAE